VRRLARKSPRFLAYWAIVSQPHAGARADEGAIVTVYLDAERMHYVVPVCRRLANAAAADQLTVLEGSEW
jgi:hypothetical protein